jgi:CysZ protein
MLTALVLAFQQLADPPVRRLVLRCVALALATFLGLVAGAGMGLAMLDLTGLAWLDTVVAFAGFGLAVIAAWLLFPAVVVITLNLFAEEVVEAVERRHYPQLPPAQGLSLARSSWAALRLAALAVLLNLLALPFYLLPGANVLIYLALNGYLIGREYFELVAQRRLVLPEVGALRRVVRGRIWLAGVGIAVMLTIPLLNLVAPVIASAFMAHLFHRWQARLPAAHRPPERVEMGKIQRYHSGNV